MLFYTIMTCHHHIFHLSIGEKHRRGCGYDDALQTHQVKDRKSPRVTCDFISLLEKRDSFSKMSNQ